MAVLTPLVTAKTLRTSLSLSTYMAVFDDANTGSADIVDSSEQVRLVLVEAHAMVVSFLGDLYTKIPNGTDSELPQLLVHAELLYARAISFDRHPEYTRTFGDNPLRDSHFKQAT